jgi:hypothetical protein
MPLGADQKLAPSLAIGESVQRCLTGDLTLPYRQKQYKSTCVKVCRLIIQAPLQRPSRIPFPCMSNQA